MIKPKTLASLCLPLALSIAQVAYCSALTGEVYGPQGTPLQGAQVTVTDSNGKVVGQATTNRAGKYCITGLQPGDYSNTITPPSGAGLETGTTKADVPTEGLTQDWSLATNAVGSSSSYSPGACGAFAWAGDAAVLAPLGVLALGLGAGFIALGTEHTDGSSSSNATPSM